MKIIKTIVVDITFAEVAKQVMKYHPKGGIVKPVVSYDDCMTLFCDTVRKYRFGLFGSFAHYRIVCNGYGTFKYIELSDKSKRIEAEQVIAKLMTFDIDSE